MKKFMMAAVALICMTMTTAALISCGGDDDDKGSGGSKYTTAALDFTLVTSDDALAYMDVTAEYYDANGKLQSEKLTQTTFKKTVKSNLPAYLGARLLFSVKQGIDVSTIGKATIVYGYEYNVWCENAKGERTGYNTNGNKGQSTVSGDKLEGWASEHSGLMKFGFDYTADGNIVNTGWK